ncbi:radical SAM protein [Pseudomonas sp. Fl5BN2]|uniref:coproporphyrinogen-III oxidase family protein n=1 Tax=Pseudomonas sp. Fl5BN2 TaxID=2697652 RepID=UPI001377A205|nr:coproporphyrinogen-III oxidase family protein [Pseudomonas sp. Fl5BN2]NBF04609.1 radical SAM protein [Pseudomonas sp. Fl5BN2]
MNGEFTLNPMVRSDPAYVFHYPRKFLWSDQIPPTRKWTDFDVYLHVPFCRAICTYCTFERRTYSKKAMELYENSLTKEIEKRFVTDDFSKGTLRAVYLGGGTASLLKTSSVASILDSILSKVTLNPNIECTLECEPATKKTDDFIRLSAHGVNRVSVGVQTLDNKLLKRLNRKHTARHALDMIDGGLAAGMMTVHADLMFGLPGQTLKQWQSDVECIAASGVHHISAYQLIVFEKELLSRRLAQGSEPDLPGDAEVREMRHCVNEVLQRKGFIRYSLTEYCLPGHECNYVKGNWAGDDYLGFGPAAYSRSGDWLWENEVTVSGYCRILDGGKLPVNAIRMVPFTRALRDLSMGLCFFNVDLKRVYGGLTVDERAVIDSILKALSESEYVSVTKDGVLLTEVGKLYATYVMNEIIRMGESVCAPQLN